MKNFISKLSIIIRRFCKLIFKLTFITVLTPFFLALPGMLLLFLLWVITDESPDNIYALILALIFTCVFWLFIKWKKEKMIKHLMNFSEKWLGDWMQPSDPYSY
jgi:MFS superfamily sulfate permease-like transporter